MLSKYTTIVLSATTNLNKRKSFASQHTETILSNLSHFVYN